MTTPAPSRPRRRVGPTRQAITNSFGTDPRRVGSEPDYRFTLANERSYLAWTRTALALAAGGLGTITVIDTFYGQELMGLLLLGLSFITAATSYRRWSANERSIRLERPLPPSILPQVMTIGTALVAIAASVLVIVGKL